MSDIDLKQLRSDCQALIDSNLRAYVEPRSLRMARDLVVVVDRCVEAESYRDSYFQNWNEATTRLERAERDAKQPLIEQRDAAIERAERAERERDMLSASLVRWKAETRKDVDRLAELNAALQAGNEAVDRDRVEHVELNGHIELVEQCRDWIAHEANDDTSGKLQDFVESLRIVIDQLDKQRRACNWYEASTRAGKDKLIESRTADLTTQRDAAIAELDAVNPKFKHTLQVNLELIQRAESAERQLAEAHKAIGRLLLYVDLHEQAHPEWNGNRFDDRTFAERQLAAQARAARGSKGE